MDLLSFWCSPHKAEAILMVPDFCRCSRNRRNLYFCWDVKTSQYVMRYSFSRWNPYDGQWHKQPGPIPYLQEARPGGCALPDGTAPSSHPRSRLATAHHPDEVCGRLRIQRGVWSKCQVRWADDCVFCAVGFISLLPVPQNGKNSCSAKSASCCVGGAIAWAGASVQWGRFPTVTSQHEEWDVNALLGNLCPF